MKNHFSARKFQLGIRSLFAIVAIAALSIVAGQKIHFWLTPVEEINARLLTANVRHEGGVYAYQDQFFTQATPRIDQPKLENLRYLMRIQNPFTLQVRQSDADHVYKYLRKSKIQELSLFWGDSLPVSPATANAIAKTRVQKLRISSTAVKYDSDLYDAMSSMKSLRELSTYDCSEEQIAAIAAAPNLEALNFWWEHSPPITVKSLQLLADMPALERLELRSPIAVGSSLSLLKGQKLKSLAIYAPDEQARKAIEVLRRCGINVTVKHRQWSTTDTSPASLEKFAASRAEHLCFYPDCTLSVEGMQQLVTIENLRELTLQCKLADDESLELLTNAPNLERLTIQSGIQVSESVAAKLRNSKFTTDGMNP